MIDRLNIDDLLFHNHLLVKSADSYETTTFLFVYFIFKLYVKSAIQKHVSVAPNKQWQVPVWIGNSSQVCHQDSAYFGKYYLIENVTGTCTGQFQNLWQIIYETLKNNYNDEAFKTQIHSPQLIKSK